MRCGLLKTNGCSYRMDWGMGSWEAPGQRWGRDSFELDIWKMLGQKWGG